MTNLIAAVVALVLMLAAGIAGYSYFGPAFDEGNGYNQLATYATQTLQVDGAYRAYLFDHDGVQPAGDDAEKLATLVSDGYLANAPEGQWVFTGGIVYQNINSLTQCRLINNAAMKDLTPASAYQGCPPCSDAAFSTYPGCTRDPNAD